MIRKFFASILFSVFVLAFMPVALSVGVYKTFLDPNFYHGEFIELVYDFAINELPRDVDLTGIPITESELRDILATVFVENDLSKLVDVIFAQLYALEVESDGMAEFTIPLDWLTDKSDIIAEKVAGFLANELPDCESGVEFIPDSLNCVPKAISRLDFKNRLISEFDREFFSDVPNEVSFTLNFPKQIKGNVFDFFDDLILKVLMIGVLVLLLLLFLIGLIIFSPWPLVFRWVCRSLFFASLSVFVLMMTLLHLPMQWLGEFGYESVGRIYSFVVSALISNMFVYIFPILVFSFGLWVIMIFLHRYRKNVIS